MVSPKIKDGHIDFANELAEFMARYRISGEEWQVLLVIMRKTWGWHKSWDRISLKQFWKATRMKKPSILRALNKLLSKNIISKRANKNPHTWHINSHFDRWKIISKKANVSNKANGVSKRANVISKRANFQPPQPKPDKRHRPPKETITKETITKERMMIRSQISNLILQFPDELKMLIDEYIENARMENKTQEITLNKQKRLLNELYQEWSKCNIEILKADFKTALRITVNKQVPNINYLKKIMKGIANKRALRMKEHIGGHT